LVPNYPAPIATIDAMTVVPLRRIAPVLWTVCAVHALLLWWVFSQRQISSEALTPVPVMSARWLTGAPAKQDEPVVTPRPSATAVRAAAPRARRETASPREPVPADPVAQPGPAAPAVEPPLLADSIQHAVREAARHKGLGVSADEQLGRAPVDAQAALRSGMASAAHGDCLKGGEAGYARSGMGLLALPMLALDLVAGRCAK
jgi:hypothetical protein